MQKGASTTSDSLSSAGLSVGAMFDRIAPTYDVLNHLLSWGRDSSWRRQAVRCLGARDALKVIDLATGTGDLLVALLQERPNVTEAVGVDVSEEMLALGRSKIARHGFVDRVRLVHDDAVNTALPADSFDAVTMAFGIRNTPDARATLHEIHRLLKPGGTAVILEFSLPGNGVWRRCYLAYLRLVVPVLGALVSGDKGAYRYLNQSIEAFHRPDAFGALMTQAGFSEVSSRPLTGGVASIYTGLKVRTAGVI